MTATTERGPVVKDPVVRGGFIERNGIQVGAIGDDGEVFIALGHHEPDAVLAAFEAMAEYMGWDPLAESMGDVPGYPLTDMLWRRWAVFTEYEGGSNWWCDYEATEPVPDAIPVTILNTEV